MNITRKQFLTGLFGVSAIISIPLNGVASVTGNSEFNKCRNDIVYFVEHYITRGGKPVVLREIQKTYLKRISGNNVFACKKSRQAGITMMNTFYALWRAYFFENQHIEMVFCKMSQAAAIRYGILMSKIGVIGFTNGIADDKYHDGSYKLAFNNGNSIKLNWYSNFANSPKETDDSNIIIADELAFAESYGSCFTHRIKEWFDNDTKTFIAVSTPFREHDVFGLLYTTLSDDHKMTITIYDYISSLQNFNSDKVKNYIGEKYFDQEYLCKV